MLNKYENQHNLKFSRVVAFARLYVNAFALNFGNSDNSIVTVITMLMAMAMVVPLLCAVCGWCAVEPLVTPN